ncbi:uncharacterized protein LOC133799929 [Humulus lupulus]|uniref:uncharacterized protein LOC133799929 n=1 Tax=Humulus lupulus TaxID=3486 RepID=UPI002B4086E3|nr:uncharacterized protein LOC133799929 [Humulus lupulus]
MFDYFSGLFTASDTNWERIISGVQRKITDDMNQTLLARIDKDEVKEALFQMHPDKAPGPDGFNPGFYQKYWDIVGSDVYQDVLNFMEKGDFGTQLKETNIVLIPKTSAPQFMSDLRPIALCNVVYKIVSKVLANRLKNVLHHVISEAQSAFIPGRLITDNILVSFEVMHYMKRKRAGKEAFMAIKLDMSKVYDRVEWGFLEAMLQKMGLHARWVDLIMRCVSGVRYTITTEGKEIGPIIPSRGLRQGDPLSPYLFLICAEGLSTLLSDFERQGKIRGCKVARATPSISHMFFADDIYLYCRATAEEAYHVVDALSIFQRASGQQVNLNKSSVFFSSNAGEACRREMCSILNMQEADEHSMYLGLPNILGRRKNAILGFLKERMRSKIQSWENKFLSKPGKETLIKSIAQALPSYAMGVFLIPKGMCEDMEKLMCKFWWKSGSSNNRGVHWSSWERLSIHKSKGGMGFRSLQDFNLALLSKQGWRLLCKPHSLVGRLFKARYYTNGSFLEAEMGSNPSYVWRSIFEARSLVVEGARLKVGNGSSIRMGHDPWLPKATHRTPLSLHPELTNNLVQSLMIPVSLVWDRDLVRDIFSPEDAEIILSIPLSLDRLEDSWYWVLEKSGLFSVNSVYRVLQDRKEEAALGLNCVRLFGGSFAEWIEQTWLLLDQTRRQSLVMLCWGLWKARNDLVWRNKRLAPNSVVVVSNSVFNQWSQAQHKSDIPTAAYLTDADGVEKWQCPNPGSVKVNMDAALFPDLGTYSFACLARDELGHPIEALSRCFNGHVAPELAEAMGFREALSWIKKYNWPRVILESDCLLVIQALRSNVSMLSYFGDVISECKTIWNSSNNVSCMFVKRSANKAAHAIAKAFYSPADRIYKEGEFPSSILNVILGDAF